MSDRLAAVKAQFDAMIERMKEEFGRQVDREMEVLLEMWREEKRRVKNAKMRPSRARTGKRTKNENVQLKQSVDEHCDRKREWIDDEQKAQQLANKRIKTDNQAVSQMYTEFPPVTRVHDHCLVALFKQLPPADQMTARTVCRRWADLVPNVTQSTRTLAIFVGNRSMDYFEKNVNSCSLGSIKVVSLLKKADGSPLFPVERFSEWNTLKYRRELNEATVEAITATFVNLDTLQIALYDAPSSQMDFISRLLEQLTHYQLRTLKVWELSYSCRSSSDFIDRFFAAINGLSTLKNLHLDLSFFPYRDLPIISQLEQLHVNWNGCPPRQFAAMLRQYANITLRSIEYICKHPDSSIEHFTLLGDRFTRFGIFWYPLSISEVISIHFRHLTSISIETTATTTLRRLFGHLSQLTQLLYLWLNIDFASLLPDDQPHLLLQQLPSVKALQLQLTIHSHRNLEQLNISWTMPNLQVIYFHLWMYSKCTDCAIRKFCGHHITGHDNLPIVKNCYRQMFVPLKRSCSQLRAILYDREKIFGSVDELLAAE